MLGMRAAINVALASPRPAACGRIAQGGESARVTIEGAGRLLEQRVAIGGETRVTRLCLDPATETLLADLARRQTMGAGSSKVGASLGPRGATVQSRWLGGCPAGLKPGEMIGPDGRRYAIAELARPPRPSGRSFTP